MTTKKYYADMCPEEIVEALRNADWQNLDANKDCLEYRAADIIEDLINQSNLPMDLGF